MHGKLLTILMLSLILSFTARGQADFANGLVSGYGQAGNVSYSFGEIFYHQKTGPSGLEAAEGLQQAQLLHEVYDTAFCQNDVRPVYGFEFHSVDADGNLIPAGQYDSSHYCGSFLNYDSLTELTLTVWPIYELYDTLRLSYEEMLAMRLVPGRNDSLLRSENDCDSLLHYMVYVCGFPNVADADANSYGNIFLGNDCWLNSNLRTTHYTADAAARQGTGTEAASMIYRSYEFPDTERNLAVYGRLYTWYSGVGLPESSTDEPVATDEGFVQGICPDGWHVPNDVNMRDLMDFGAVALSSDSLWIVPTGDNSSGFNALPAGFYNPGRNRFEGLLNSMSYNQLAVSYFKKAGWDVIEHAHKGMEPPQSDKYLLWGLILREERENLPLVRFNGDKCRYTLISMNNAMIKDVDGQLKKDKSSERKTSGVLPEEATHFSDAADKIIWTKFGGGLKGKNENFVPVRVGK